MRARLALILVACWYGSTGCESPTLSSADLQPYERDQGVDLPIAGETNRAGTEGSGMGGDEVPLGGMTPGGGSIADTTSGDTAGNTAGDIAGDTSGDTSGDTVGNISGEDLSGMSGGAAGEMSGEMFMLCGDITEEAIPALKPVDIIWVIDSSPSMREEIDQIQQNLNSFTDRISMAGLDLRVALVAAEEDLATPGRDYIGVCIPPPLSGADACPDIDSERYRHVRLNVHSQDPLEKMIEATPQLVDFLRPDSLKHLVFITDDDAGWGVNSMEFLSFVNNEPMLNGVIVHSVVDLIGYMSSCAFDDSCSCGEERGETYISLSMTTDGGVFSVCEEDWTPLFERLEERVIEGTELACTHAFPQDSQSFMFSADEVNIYWTPVNEAERVIPRVDNEAACGDEEGWYYDDPISPELIHLCPVSCGSVVGTIRLEFGCMVIKR